MSSPLGSLCTNLVYITPNQGNTHSEHSMRITGTFPGGSSIAYVPVGQLAADDLVILNQRKNVAGTGLKIQPSRSLQVNDSVSGYVELISEDNLNVAADIPFDLSVMRNA